MFSWIMLQLLHIINLLSYYDGVEHDLDDDATLFMKDNQLLYEDHLRGLDYIGEFIIHTGTNMRSLHKTSIKRIFKARLQLQKLFSFIHCNCMIE